ncbi:MAG: hypothetical protein KatS3mg022_2708 [Armatimonadota bacterium]|nr:MAG: hypothetical protein KatS3mg022_2708 [Armatimonadota bacterium]
MRWKTIAALVALCTCAVVPLWAQPEPGEPSPPPEPPVDVPSEPVMPPPPPTDLGPPAAPPPQQLPQQARQTGSDVRQVLADIAQRFRLQVVVDPLLQRRVTPPAQAKDAPAALDAVVKQIPGVIWRKVYLRADMELPASETLINWVRSVINLEAQGLIVADATGNRITSFVRNVTVSPDFEQQLDQMVPAFKTRPVYVVFYQQPMVAQQAGQRGRQGQTRAEDFLALEQQRMQLFMQMTPEERQRAMRMGIQMFMNMDPSLRMQMMQEGLRMFMNMSPEERRMLMEQGMQMFQQMMGGPPPGPPAPGR